MVSEKQLEANKKNAKLGGVKTPEGKETSKLNALKHGLLSKEALLDDENKEELVSLEKSLRKELKPVGTMEQILVGKIVTNIWRLKRAIRIETEMMKSGCKGDEFSFTGEKSLGEAMSYDFVNYDSYGKFTRYEASIENGLYKALNKLQELQSRRN